MKTVITIEMDNESGKLGVFAPLETIEQREMTAKILGACVQIVLDHRPKTIVAPPAGFDPGKQNGKPLSVA